MQVTPVSAPRVPAGEQSGMATNRLSRTKAQGGREGIHDLPESDAASMYAGCAGRRVGRISDRPGSLNKVAGVRRGQGRGRRRGGKGTRGVVSLPSLYQSPNKGSVRYMRVQREVQ